MSGLDDVELARLEETIGLAKSLFGVMTSGHDSNGIPLAASVADAERRIETLENEGAVGSAEKERRDAEKLQNAAVLFLVQKEINLTHSERESFGEFLSKEYFTKSDFDELDQFYGSAWDRLSERGKSEMSQRTWEGIRQGEYEFTDLPKNVKEKEFERLFGILSDPAKITENLKQIPEKDRDEFIQTYQSGDKEKAAELLNKDSFKENVSTSLSKKAESEKQTLESQNNEGKVLQSDSFVSAPKPSELRTGSKSSEINSLEL